MPEEPEVQRYADALHQVLAEQSLIEISARTKTKKRWLQTYSGELVDRKITAVTAYGKTLIGWIEGEYYYSHLMMWGSWQTLVEALPVEIDRRERARIVVPTDSVILYSAPVFEL